MIRRIPVLALILALSASSMLLVRVAAQGGQAEAPVNVTGEWSLTIEANQPQLFRGAVDQQGTKLTGYMGDEIAEYPATGSVQGSTMTISWTMFQRGDEIKITVTGKVDKDAMTGTAKIGTYAEGVKVTGQKTGG